MMHKSAFCGGIGGGLVREGFPQHCGGGGGAQLVVSNHSSEPVVAEFAAIRLGRTPLVIAAAAAAQKQSFGTGQR